MALLMKFHITAFYIDLYYLFTLICRHALHHITQLTIMPDVLFSWHCTVLHATRVKFRHGERGLLTFISQIYISACVMHGYIWIIIRYTFDLIIRWADVPISLAARRYSYELKEYYIYSLLSKGQRMRWWIRPRWCGRWYLLSLIFKYADDLLYWIEGDDGFATGGLKYWSMAPSIIDVAFEEEHEISFYIRQSRTPLYAYRTAAKISNTAAVTTLLSISWLFILDYLSFTMWRASYAQAYAGSLYVIITMPCFLSAIISYF